jgi:alkanesulfonate monooxygenase SsuD/methylene tetrahydromethanopterin reductase-like flavin-dependent oxidoreductase (luciferase family)
MQALWAEQHVTFKGKWHTIEDAGINPLPVNRRIPVWFGGNVDQTLERIATLGDGWIMNAYPPDDTALAAFAKLRRLTEQAGRDPAQIGIEVWMSCGAGTEADWREEARFWRRAGATHLTLFTAFGRRHHTRIAGRSVAEHLTAIRRFHDAVADVA